MKLVTNSKTWDEYGWIYSMRRVKFGKQYAINVAIAQQKLHYRNIIAMKLLDARRQLREGIERDQAKSLLEHP